MTWAWTWCTMALAPLIGLSGLRLAVTSKTFCAVFLFKDQDVFFFPHVFSVFFPEFLACESANQDSNAMSYSCG